MSDKMLSADTETNILAVAYTVYSELCENPITPTEFHEKFSANGSVFHDLVCGTSKN